LYQIKDATINDASGIAKVHIDSWKSTYSNDLLPQAYLDNLDYEARTNRWKEILSQLDKKSHCHIATNQDQIIGFCCGGPNRDDDINYDSEIYAIYLLEHYHRQGIGKDLFQKSIARLINNNFKSMVLWVLKENPTVKFYQHMGGKKIKEKKDVIGGREITEIGLGWSELK